jgi:hypothetical protein
VDKIIYKIPPSPFAKGGIKILTNKSLLEKEGFREIFENIKLILVTYLLNIYLS